MGWCQEFGAVIRTGCDHGMVAAADHCECPECGTVCPGKFEACPDVWAKGQPPVTERPALEDRSEALAAVAAPAPAPNGGGPRPVELRAPAEPAAGSRSTVGERMERLYQGLAAGADPGGSLDQASVDQLLGVLDRLPERIGAALAEHARAQQHDLENAADRLTVVLARRVAEEIGQREPGGAGGTGPVAGDRAHLAELVEAQQERIDQLTAMVEELSQATLTHDHLQALRQGLVKAFRAMNERMDERDRLLDRRLQTIEEALSPPSRRPAHQP